MLDFIKKLPKTTAFFYILVNILVIICLITEFINWNLNNIILCVFSLVLFYLPFYIKKKFNIFFPPLFEILILLFIFSTQILRRNL